MTTGKPEPLTRCPWCGDDPLYVAYHDHEWGVPVRDGVRLFEMLSLEGAQAGLSWITVLRKRERYREVFAGFDIEKVAAMGEPDLERLVTDPGIIRHRGKLASVIGAARIILHDFQSADAFAAHLWSFVNDTPVVGTWHSLAEMPGHTPASDAMSRDLKKRGFKFVGSTICYSFMQATGMVDDHLAGCFRRSKG